MMASSGRTAPLRVAIIGGGCGAMTAADFLTRPEQQGRFAVTVFQEGWRLGGKGASGRGASGRIEEHGLHIWLGHYDNSFRMMRDCYAELEASAKGHLFGDWRDAFLPEPDIGLFSPHETGGWQRWTGRVALPSDGYFEVWYRATDSQGRMQPHAAANWNPQGYGANPISRAAILVG
jgi:uncharacterized protein with NAD-binding domain and iron-sulfur cluster